MRTTEWKAAEQQREDQKNGDAFSGDDNTHGALAMRLFRVDFLN